MGIEFQNPRAQVSTVGFLATWWMGPPIGMVLGLVGFIHSDAKKMFWITMQAIGVTVIVAFITGLFGLALGYFYLSGTDLNWWFPANLINKKAFITVGSMHNFSYLGGLLGLVTGIIFIMRKKEKPSTEFHPQ
jgi:hypothetical protein